MEDIHDAGKSDGVHAAIGRARAIFNDLAHTGAAKVPESPRCLVLPTYLRKMSGFAGTIFSVKMASCIPDC
jgi:hypothetical protein